MLSPSSVISPTKGRIQAYADTTYGRTHHLKYIHQEPGLTDPIAPVKVHSDDEFSDWPSVGTWRLGSRVGPAAETLWRFWSTTDQRLVEWKHRHGQYEEYPLVGQRLRNIQKKRTELSQQIDIHSTHNCRNPIFNLSPAHEEFEPTVREEIQQRVIEKWVHVRSMELVNGFLFGMTFLEDKVKALPDTYHLRPSPMELLRQKKASNRIEPLPDALDAARKLKTEADSYYERGYTALAAWDYLHAMVALAPWYPLEWFQPKSEAKLCGLTDLVFALGINMGFCAWRLRQGAPGLALMLSLYQHPFVNTKQYAKCWFIYGKCAENYLYRLAPDHPLITAAEAVIMSQYADSGKKNSDYWSAQPLNSQLHSSEVCDFTLQDIVNAGTNLQELLGNDFVGDTAILEQVSENAERSKVFYQQRMQAKVAELERLAEIQRQIIRDQAIERPVKDIPVARIQTGSSSSPTANTSSYDFRAQSEAEAVREESVVGSEFIPKIPNPPEPPQESSPLVSMSVVAVSEMIPVVDLISPTSDRTQSSSEESALSNLIEIGTAQSRGGKKKPVKRRPKGRVSNLKEEWDDLAETARRYVKHIAQRRVRSASEVYTYRLTTHDLWWLPDRYALGPVRTLSEDKTNEDGDIYLSHLPDFYAFGAARGRERAIDVGTTKAFEQDWARQNYNIDLVMRSSDQPSTDKPRVSMPARSMTEGQNRDQDYLSIPRSPSSSSTLENNNEDIDMSRTAIHSQRSETGSASDIASTIEDDESPRLSLMTNHILPPSSTGNRDILPANSLDAIESSVYTERASQTADVANAQLRATATAANHVQATSAQPAVSTRTRAEDKAARLASLEWAVLDELLDQIASFRSRTRHMTTAAEDAAFRRESRMRAEELERQLGALLSG